MHIVKASRLLGFFSLFLLTNNAFAADFSKNFYFESHAPFSLECVRKAFINKNEDRSFNDVSTLPGMFLVAMVDGHGGPWAADKVQRNLASAIKENCLKENNYFNESALSTAFTKVDEKVFLSKKDAGAVASAVILGLQDEQVILRLAYIGDVRVVLGVSSGHDTIALSLVKDHHPDNPIEIARLAHDVAHAQVSDKKRPREPILSEEKPRIRRKIDFNEHGSERQDLFSSSESIHNSESSEEASFALPLCKLSNIRLNDLREESPKSLISAKCWIKETSLQVTRSFGHKGLKSRGLSAEPEFYRTTLDTTHQFLLLYSDGVSDLLSDQEAVDIVAQGLKEQLELDKIAHRILCRAAKISEDYEGQHWCSTQANLKDDMSVIIILFRRPIK